MFVFRRYLSVKTTVNPKQVHLTAPSGHSNLLLFTTPSQLNSVVENVYSLSKERPITAVVGCVDSMLGHRNGVSELWFKNPLSIDEHQVLPDDKKEMGAKSQFSKVAPIRMDKNWTNTVEETMLLMNDIVGHSVGVRLASTLFANSEPSTCFFVQGDHPDNWKNLARLEISLPEELGQATKIDSWNKLRELEFEADRDPEGYLITDYMVNMIDTINGQPASEYLINNKEIQKSKRDLYLQLIDQTQKDRIHSTEPSFTDKVFRITVGGLGWGGKQETIVLDTIAGDVGHSYCRLYQHDPTLPSHEYISPVEGMVKIGIECSDLEEGFQKEYDGAEEAVFQGIAGVGSENGYMVDGIWHKSHGEGMEVTTDVARAV